MVLFTFFSNEPPFTSWQLVTHADQPRTRLPPSSLRPAARFPDTDDHQFGYISAVRHRRWKLLQLLLLLLPFATAIAATVAGSSLGLFLGSTTRRRCPIGVGRSIALQWLLGVWLGWNQGWEGRNTSSELHFLRRLELSLLAIPFLHLSLQQLLSRHSSLCSISFSLFFFHAQPRMALLFLPFLLSVFLG